MIWRYRLRLKGFLVSVAAFSGCLVLFIVLILAGRPREDIDIDLDCYFLVRDCDGSTSAAVVGEVYSAGGAGYLYGDTVILACYYTKADARRVCSLMERAGEEVTVLARSFEKLTLRGDKVGLKETLLGGISTVDSTARLLYDTANGLETGRLTQTAAKANIRGAADALDGLIAANGPALAAWNSRLYEASRRARENAAGILFAKDVRFLQAALLCSLLDLKNFV